MSENTVEKKAPSRRDPRRFEDIPEPFQPPHGNRTGLRMGGAPLMQALPCSSLSPELRILRGYHYQPPRFRYGWVLPFKELQVFRSNFPSLVGLRIFQCPTDIMCLYRTSDKMAVYTRDVLGLTSLTPAFHCVRGRPVFILAIADSYVSPVILPTAQDIEKFRNWLACLSLKGEPAWYLDLMNGTWEKRRIDVKGVKKSDVKAEENE